MFTQVKKKKTYFFSQVDAVHFHMTDWMNGEIKQGEETEEHRQRKKTQVKNSQMAWYQTQHLCWWGQVWNCFVKKNICPASNLKYTTISFSCLCLVKQCLSYCQLSSVLVSNLEKKVTTNLDIYFYTLTVTSDLK